jgi:hypothetical protein
MKTKHIAKKDVNTSGKALPLLLHTALVDWITATSYDDGFFDWWEMELLEECRSWSDKKIMQYTGRMFEIEGGTAFLGVAEQRGLFHYMLRLSGYAAEDRKGYVWSSMRNYMVKVTRLDLQVTRPIDKSWSQWELVKRLKEKGRKTGWIESGTKAVSFETVYIGSRTSERFTRIYVKMAGGTRLLRLEVEYKGKRSDAIARRLSRGDLSSATAGQYLMHEVQKTYNDEPLRMLFEPALNGVKPITEKLKVESSTEKTEKWLLEQVLPAFTRHINDHSASPQVVNAFTSAIARSCEWD